MFPSVNIRYDKKFAIYQLLYIEDGMLKSEAIQIPIKEIIETITLYGRVESATRLHLKFNYPILDEVKFNKIESAVYGFDAIETIIDTISPLIGV